MEVNEKSERFSHQIHRGSRMASRRTDDASRCATGTEAKPNLSPLSPILTPTAAFAPSPLSPLPKCPSPPLPLSPQRFVARSLVSVGRRRQREERREGEAVAHLNGYPAYRLPCHVSLRRFLGRGNDADTRPEVVWGVVESARKRALPLGGEWVENYLSPAAADT